MSVEIFGIGADIGTVVVYQDCSFMIDGNIDYTRYPNEELAHVLQRIDRQRVPRNYANLIKEIESRPTHDAEGRSDKDKVEWNFNLLDILLSLLSLLGASHK